jgi:hypothetical protein
VFFRAEHESRAPRKYLPKKAKKMCSLGYYIKRNCVICDLFYRSVGIATRLRAGRSGF